MSLSSSMQRLSSSICSMSVIFSVSSSCLVIDLNSYGMLETLKTLGVTSKATMASNPAQCRCDQFDGVSREHQNFGVELPQFPQTPADFGVEYSRRQSFWMDGKKRILIVTFLGRISVKSRKSMKKQVGRQGKAGEFWGGVEASRQKLRPASSFHDTTRIRREIFTIGILLFPSIQKNYPFTSVRCP